MRRAVIRRAIGGVRRIMSALWGAYCVRRAFNQYLNCATLNTLV